MELCGFLCLGGGLLIFLLGVQVLSGPLRAMAETRLLARLEHAARRPIQGLLYGAAVTAVLQSSSALTVFLVGLTGAGAMSLEAATVLLMGANVGTTLSPWLLGLSGLFEGPALLRPEVLCPLLALGGVVLSAKPKRHGLGRLLLGLSLLLGGMQLMQRAAEHLPALTRLSPGADHPLRGVLMGTVATGILQSSAGAVGMLQALCTSGALTLGGIIPLLIGLNLGTCVTALLASLGAGPEARRVAVVHVGFNALGGMGWLLPLYGFGCADLLCQPATPISVAVLHSLFNLSTAAVLLPLRRYLVQMAMILVPGNDGKTAGASSCRVSKKAFLPRGVRFSRFPSETRKTF